MRKFSVQFEYQAGDSVSTVDVRNAIYAALKDILPAGVVVGNPTVVAVPSWTSVDTDNDGHADRQGHVDEARGL